jgi:glycosyltransferase involved in cell wall biosynthesis
VPAPASPGPRPPAEPPPEASPAAAPAPGAQAGRAGRVALVVGTTSGGTGAHVRMLAGGFAGRGIGVVVLGPSSADALFGFGAVAGVTFAPVEFGDRPRLGDVAAVLRLRRLLRPGAGRTRRRRPANDVVLGRAGPDDSGAAGVAAWPDVAHAHGLRAGALTVIALAGRRRRTGAGRRPLLVVTVHNAPPAARGARAAVYRLLERVVARGADLVLCVSSDLEERMRSAGARRVDRAIVPPADAVRKPPSDRATPPHRDQAPPAPGRAAQAMTAVPATTSIPAALSAARVAGRPMILAVGRLAAQKDFGTLLAAATHWRDLDPEPQLVIAGDGPLAGELGRRATALGVDAAFLGRRDDVAELLASATVFVLPSRWEGQPLILQEALRAGAAIVATRVGGVPDLVGVDAAVLVGPGDAQALAAAVRGVLADPPLAARLRAAAAARGAALPTPADAVAAALAVYGDALARPATRR